MVDEGRGKASKKSEPGPADVVYQHYTRFSASCKGFPLKSTILRTPVPVPCGEQPSAHLCAWKRRVRTGSGWNSRSTTLSCCGPDQCACASETTDKASHCRKLRSIRHTCPRDRPSIRGPLLHGRPRPAPSPRPKLLPADRFRKWDLLLKTAVNAIAVIHLPYLLMLIPVSHSHRSGIAMRPGCLVVHEAVLFAKI